MPTIRDAVWGDIELSRDEMRIIDTPEFQRLRGIRQLGTSYLVFPSAQHTRFEHSMGTSWVVKRMIDRINYRAKRADLSHFIDEDETRFLRFAALLHDITHIPYGHTFEDERRILPAHDNSSERLRYFLYSQHLGSVLKDLGVRDALFDFFVHGKKREPNYGYHLVAGPICADLLDYLRRDAYFCGLDLNFDERVFRYLNIEGGRLCFNLYTDRGFRQDAWSELISLLRIRFHLTERVYFHHSKMVSGAMLSRVLEALLEKGAILPEQLYSLRDDAFLYLLDLKIKKARAYRPLWEAFCARTLYKRVYMVARDPLKPDFPPKKFMERFQRDFHLNENGARSDLEQRLARHLNIPAWAIVIYAPETNMRLKEARVNVRVNAGPLVCLNEIKNPELQALSDRHQALWKFFLFMHPKYETKFIKASQFLEAEIGLPNQLELFNKGQLTLNF